MTSHHMNSNQSTKEDLSLKELILKIQDWYYYLISKWFIIAVVVIAGSIVGYTYGYFKKTIYVATTTFVLEDGGGSGGGLGQYAGLASMVGIDIGGGGGLFSGDNIIELYKSRSMLQKALLTSVKFEGKEQMLIDRFIEFNELSKEWSKNARLKNINFQKDTAFSIVKDSVLSEVVKDISKNYLLVGKPDKKLSIIKVELRSRDELFAKAFADVLVSTVNRFYLETKTKRSIDNVTILQHQADSVRAIMNGAIFASAFTLDATPNRNPPRQILRAPVQKSQFTAEANKAILGELVKNLELSKISLRKETPLIQVIDKPILPLEKEKFSKVKGLIIGAMLFGFFTVLILMFKKIYKEIIAND